jgi:hypothetical protein
MTETCTSVFVVSAVDFSDFDVLDVFESRSEAESYAGRIKPMYPGRKIWVEERTLWRAGEHVQTPSAIYRPDMGRECRRDGDGRLLWVARYDCIEGWGDSPKEAMADFDRAWNIATEPEEPKP